MLLGEFGCQVQACLRTWQENRGAMLLLELKHPQMQNSSARSPVMLFRKGVSLETWLHMMAVQRAAKCGDPDFISQVTELRSHRSQACLADQKAVPGRAL